MKTPNQPKLKLLSETLRVLSGRHLRTAHGGTVLIPTKNDDPYPTGDCREGTVGKTVGSL